MFVWIKNEDTIDRTWVGQTILVGQYHKIEAGQLAQWSSNEELLADIATGKAVVARSDDGQTDMGINDGIDWLKGIDPTPRDSENAPISRQKTTKTGWHYEPRALDFFTSSHGSLYNRKHNGNQIDDGDDYGDASIHFFNSSGLELTYQQTGYETETELEFQARLDSGCVLSYLDWQPDYNMDIIGGIMMLKDTPASRAYMWTIVAPEIPEIYGGSVPHVAGGWNLEFFDTKDKIKIDGRGIKTIAYDPVYNSNKFRTIIKHSPGVKIGIQIVFEKFKE